MTQCDTSLSVKKLWFLSMLLSILVLLMSYSKREEEGEGEGEREGGRGREWGREGEKRERRGEGGKREGERGKGETSRIAKTPKRIQPLKLFSGRREPPLLVCLHIMSRKLFVS